MRTRDLELFKSVRKILVDDNKDISSDELCIHSYIADRITDNFPDASVVLPKITVNVIINDNIGNLPAENGLMYINIWFDARVTDAMMKIRMCAGRVIKLLDGQINFIKSKNANCILRIIDKINFVVLKDDGSGNLNGSISFNIIFAK